MICISSRDYHMLDIEVGKCVYCGEPLTDFGKPIPTVPQVRVQLADPATERPWWLPRVRQ